VAGKGAEGLILLLTAKGKKDKGRRTIISARVLEFGRPQAEKRRKTYQTIGERRKNRRGGRGGKAAFQFISTPDHEKKEEERKAHGGVKIGVG